jgi:hypothetical protein
LRADGDGHSPIVAEIVIACLLLPASRLRRVRILTST